MQFSYTMSLKHFTFILFLITACFYQVLLHPPKGVPPLMLNQTPLRSIAAPPSLMKNANVTCLFKDAIYYPRQWELKRTALISFPRSGNSWTRMLIQKASGFRASSIYEEKKALKPILPLWEDRFLIKTHFPLYAAPLNETEQVRPRSQLKYFDQGIYLIRNPFDCLLSYYHYQQQFQNFTAKAELQPDSLSVIDMAAYIQAYKDFYNFWSRVPLPIKAFRYEDLKVSFIFPFSVIYCILFVDGSRKGSKRYARYDSSTTNC
jgi:hypothetical protein